MVNDCIYKSCQFYLNNDETECNLSCIRYNQMKSLLELSNLPRDLRVPHKINIVMDDKDAYDRLAEIRQNIVDFVENGKNLYICSNTTGNGKTYWACKLMLTYFDKVWKNSYDITRGLYISAPSFIVDIHNFDNMPEYISRIKEADLVIWDDFASTTKGLSEFQATQLYNYIDDRIYNNKSNIFTSNVISKEALDTTIGARLSSRVFVNSEQIVFNGGDYRVKLGGN